MYSLKLGTLQARFTVTAGDSVSAAGLPFSIGNHVTFKFPFSSTGAWASGRLVGSPGLFQAGLTGFSLLNGENTPRPELAGTSTLARHPCCV